MRSLSVSAFLRWNADKFDIVARFLGGVQEVAVVFSFRDLQCKQEVGWQRRVHLRP